MRHFMFKNALAATDPVTVAQGFDLPPPPPPITDQTHTYYYSPDAYLAPCDLVLASAETITVHFNAPISVRWMKSEEQIDELDEQHLTLAVTNKGTEPVVVAKSTPLDQLLQSDFVTSRFLLVPVVYRHQLVIDTCSADHEEEEEDDNKENKIPEKNYCN
jgi:hypothetical protein